MFLGQTVCYSVCVCVHVHCYGIEALHKPKCYGKEGRIKAQNITKFWLITVPYTFLDDNELFEKG